MENKNNRLVKNMRKKEGGMFMKKGILFIGIFLIGLSLSLLVEAASIDHLPTKQFTGENVEFGGDSETKVIPINHKQKSDGITIHIPDLVISAEELAIYVESSEESDRDSGHYLRAGDIEFRITDEHGKEILSHSGEVTGTRHFGKWVFSSEKKFWPVSKDVKELRITPFLMLPTDGGGVEIDEDRNSREINFDYSKLKNVEFESFTVKIP